MKGLPVQLLRPVFGPAVYGSWQAWMVTIFAQAPDESAHGSRGAREKLLEKGNTPTGDVVTRRPGVNGPYGHEAAPQRAEPALHAHF